MVVRGGHSQGAGGMIPGSARVALEAVAQGTGPLRESACEERMPDSRSSWARRIQLEALLAVPSEESAARYTAAAGKPGQFWSGTTLLPSPDGAFIVRRSAELEATAR